MQSSSFVLRPPKFIPSCLAALALVASASLSSEVAALPGVIAGKGDAARVSNSTHLVVLSKGSRTSITVWADYDGPLDRFALVLPVPSDVELSAVRALKRDAVDHLDEITAPRFHEFWEMDACQPGEPEQEWERNLQVKEGAANFLGGDMPAMGSGPKLAPELLLEVEPQFKEGEYSFSLVPKASLKAHLSKRGMQLPAGAEERLTRYEAEGQQMLVAEVAPAKVELIGARQALLSPIRFSTQQPYAIPSTLGLVNAKGPQDLVIYVLHPERRFEVENYPNTFPPTNVNVDPSVKERVGDFYAGVHDALIAKNPKGFLVEYAWPTQKHCGEPCPNAPLGIHELLTLGADVAEADVPAAERNPKPPELSEEEKAQLKEADKDTRKRSEEQRRELARRKALLARNQYVITRLHHRYDAKGLPEDIRLRPANHVQGGIGVPFGPAAELPSAVEPASESRYQVRFAAAHPSKAVANCEAPQRFRWGKAPSSYRGLRKTWTARDLSNRKRDRFVLSEVIQSSVPALGIAARALQGVAAPSPTPAPEKESGCALSVPVAGRAQGPGGAPSGTFWAGAALFIGALLGRLRRPR